MLIVYSILTAIVAFTYSCILTEAGMILSRLKTFIEWTFPVWISKPLISCPICVSGQMAFWYYLITHLINHVDICIDSFVVYVFLTIFITKIITIISEKWQ